MGKKVREVGYKEAGESDPPVPPHYRNKLLWFLYRLYTYYYTLFMYKL